MIEFDFNVLRRVFYRLITFKSEEKIVHEDTQAQRKKKKAKVTRCQDNILRHIHAYTDTHTRTTPVI